MKSFTKILIANRGEIAVRVIKAAQKQGIRTVAVYASDDADSLHVTLADKAILFSGNTLAETYLDQDKIIQIALDSGAEAIHPGYGFLSENAEFAQKVVDSGLIFIGPSPENIQLMGEKNRALAYVESLGIQTLKSFRGTTDDILQHTFEIEFPVMVKASGGGGGKGMVIVHSTEELLPALGKAERQALSYFGNGELFVEKYLPLARHIEVQLMADHYGNVVHFFERECSVQRRFQKIIEEAPSPSVDEKLRAALCSAAVKIAQSMNYRNAGTIEFLLDENGQFYFLEMNTRIQVEHPVTEMITNTDLVSLQLLVAVGNQLSIKQEDIRISGHAIEVRLCAEDAEHQFQPSAGKIDLWQFPEKKNIRIETFVKQGITISTNYDSLLAKLIIWKKNRVDAISEMKQILSQTGIAGIHTNLTFLSELIGSSAFLRNEFYTRFIDENLNQINLEIQHKIQALNKHLVILAYLVFHLQQKAKTGNSVWNQIGFWRMFSLFEVSIDDEKHKGSIEFHHDQPSFFIDELFYLPTNAKCSGSCLNFIINEQPYLFYISEKEDHTTIVHGGFSFRVKSNLILGQVTLNSVKSSAEKIFENLICADLFGKVLKIHVRPGETVVRGQNLLTLESMKTEINILCSVNSIVKQIHVKEGSTVVEKQLMVELESPSPTFPRKGEAKA